MSCFAKVFGKLTVAEALRLNEFELKRQGKK